MNKTRKPQRNMFTVYILECVEVTKSHSFFYSLFKSVYFIQQRQSCPISAYEWFSNICLGMVHFGRNYFYLGFGKEKTIFLWEQLFWKENNRKCHDLDSRSWRITLLKNVSVSQVFVYLILVWDLLWVLNVKSFARRISHIISFPLHIFAYNMCTYENYGA